MQPSTVLPVLFEVFPRVVHIAVYITVSVSVANLVVAPGPVERIAGFSRYLMNPANLSDEVGVAIVITAASVTAGYRILAEFRRSGVLDDRAMLVAVTISTFFDFIQHIFTFYWPAFILILSHEVGFIYVGAWAAVTLAITAIGTVADAVLLVGRNTTPAAVTETDGLGGAVDAADSATDTGDSGDAAENDDSLRETVNDAIRNTWKKPRRVVPRLAVVHVAVMFPLWATDLEPFATLASSPMNLVGLSGATVPAVIAFTFNAAAGAVTTVPIISETFTPRQAVMTMLIGDIISFAVSTFRRSIPFQYNIWGPEFGSRVIAVNTGLKVVFTTVTATLSVA